MNFKLSYITLLLFTLILGLSSCEKENFDTTVETFEDPEIPSVELDGDCFVGFSFQRPLPGGGFTVMGGSTNNGVMTSELVNGITRYSIDFFVQDGIVWTQKIVFETNDTAAGDYTIYELASQSPDIDYTWDSSQLTGALTISDFSDSSTSVTGSIAVVIDDPSGDEFSYSVNFEFVPNL